MKMKTEFKIGIIVLATLIVVIWGINFLQGKNVLKSTEVYYAVFEDIQGMEASSPVYLNGFQIGMINDIRFKLAG